MKNSNKNDNCFSDFHDGSPKQKNPSLQTLLNYRESYMKLIKKYQPEIQFLQDLIDKNKAEQKEFYSITMLQVSQKMRDDPAIDDEMKTLWLKKFENNISKSFELSQRLIEAFAIKKLDEFHEEAEKMLKDM
ncbi:MAG: hypothetical protein ACI4GW_08340 [Lachnospiraceae bacterium]